MLWYFLFLEPTMTNEQMALAVASNRKLLRNRLNEARAVLVDSIRKTFGKGTFDFEKRQLIGENGYILQWKVRMRPELPESYQNQQTSRGCVVVIYKKPASEIQTPERRMAG